MVGKRIEIPKDAFDPHEVHSILRNPGDYCGPIAHPDLYDGRPMVWFILPIREDEHPSAHSLRLVCSPPHTFTEEEDGTLTIRASILSYGFEGEPDIWHGYLTKGVWEPCAEFKAVTLP